MPFDNKVIWSEGMFIRAQHFQQEARHVERLVRSRSTQLRGYAWGLAELRLNRELLGISRFAVERALGAFEDGTPFAVPDEAEHPAPLQLTENIRNTIVYLTLPIAQPGGFEAADGEVQTITRYVTTDAEVADANVGGRSAASIQVGRLRLRYALETSDRTGLLSVGLARILEVRSDGTVVLDEDYIPPALDIQVSPSLSALLTEIVGLLNHRGEALAARLAGSGTGSASETIDMLMLQSINRWQPVLTHLAQASVVHPETTFQNLISLAGEIATWTSADHRPRPFPAYQHDRLQLSFAPVAAALRQSLSAVLDQSALAIPLIEHRYGIRVAKISDRTIYAKYTFVLAVQADMAVETLARTFVGQVKIGPVEQIRELVNAALPGIPLRSLPTAPREMAHHSGKAYFELDRNHALWRSLANSSGMAIHVAGDYPGLQIELWAVKA